MTEQLKKIANRLLGSHVLHYWSDWRTYVHVAENKKWRICDECNEVETRFL